MNKKKMVNVSATLMLLCFLFGTLLWKVGFGQGMEKQVPLLPKPSKEVEERVKRAYALFVQGQCEEALAIALKVHQQHGDVMVCWYPSWVLKHTKGAFPDPYDKGSILRATVEGSGLPIPASMAVVTKSVRVLIARIYEEMGDYEEAIKWYEKVGPKLGEKFAGPGIPISQMGIIRCMQKLNQGYCPPQPPPKNTWRPLPLKFREEDYFILVPLDQACKILGLPCTITTNPKMAGGKGIRIVKPDAPNIVYRLFLGRPMVERLENGKGQTETLAYAPYEEGGVVWVPFYWLAKQAGIRWWEVRDGKIYVAPK